MGKAIELITVQATAPGAGANWLAVGGNSLTVRDAIKPTWLGPVWQSKQAAGFLRLTSPLLHDAVVGIQMQAPIGQTVTLWQSMQRIYAQDSLIVTGSGSAVAGDIEQASMLYCYEDLPGVDGYFIDDAELLRRAEDIYAFPNTISTGVAGGYSGLENVNAEVDQLKANTDYAIVGYDLTVACGSVRYISSDWGNLGVGGPGPVVGTAGALETRDWFRRVTKIMELPAIPVFNSSNKANTFIDAAQDENGGDPIITTICVRLSPKARGKRQ